MKTWEKPNRVRMETTEQGASVVILVNADTQTVFRFLPAQNIAQKMPYPSPARTAMQAVRALASLNTMVTGTEKLGGKDCMVVSFQAGDSQTRMWLWQERGFPLRLEETALAGKTVVEYSNVDFAAIPDSTFELPTGVTVTSSAPPPPPQ